MSDNIAIKVEHVSKEFKLPHEKQTSIKGALINLAKSGRRNRSYERQQVLKDISFEIKQGEFFGIVGRNGSGKSTLLKMLAGIYKPTKGHIQVNGKLTPFIELGVGFNPELTGRENVFLNGALLGFSRKEMDAMYADIVAFAELEKFMDQKLKNYSSGMQVRLAFSIAIRADTPILLLDEVLAVGDSLFQKKCFTYFKQLKRDRKTVVLVSHDIGVLQEYCERGILIEKGLLVCDDDIDTVISKYITILNQREADAVGEQSSSGTHMGSGRATITSAKLGKSVKLFTDDDDSISIVVSYAFHDAVDQPIYGLTINDASGQRIFAGNTLWSKTKTDDQVSGAKITFEWVIPNVFNTGIFTVTPAIATAGGAEMLDQADNMLHFNVSKQQTSNAHANIKYELKAQK